MTGGDHWHDHSDLVDSHLVCRTIMMLPGLWDLPLTTFSGLGTFSAFQSARESLIIKGLYV